MRSLDILNTPYSVVVEPQEYDKYAAAIGPEHLVVLPFSNLGLGSIPARNWVWEDAKAKGFARHWVLDDNLRNFYRLNNNQRWYANTPAIFRAAEDFVDRYENVPIAGFNYGMFANARQLLPPFYLNTRIYSCILIDNAAPYRWRGRYNEDTDLSLRALKDGNCTILFNAFLCQKIGTMRMKGGNTEDLYQVDGRLKMAESLQEQHPDVVTITRKWGRAQHQVNYKPFRRNRLRLKEGVVISDEPNEYGMVLRQSE